MDIRLTRTVRLMVGLDRDREPAREGENTFAGWPTVDGLGMFCELDITCRGLPDPVTGYLVNIAEIDAAVRTHALPLLERGVMTAPGRSPAMLLPDLLNAVQRGLRPTVAGLRWRLSPYHSIAMDAADNAHYLLRETFEFAAAHRLHCADLSDEENRRIFGKCNNPSGHGHNYRIEVAVKAPLPSGGMPAPFGVRHLERLVHEQILRRFDHRNLSIDTPEFASINSSVENIARVCHDLLREPIAQAGGELRHVTVWETEKTCCTYPG